MRNRKQCYKNKTSEKPKKEKKKQTVEKKNLPQKNDSSFSILIIYYTSNMHAHTHTHVPHIEIQTLR